MTGSRESDTDRMIERAAGGDRSARQELLARHRVRLRRMVALHLESRVAARVDPSDVVQDALLGAAGRGDELVARVQEALESRSPRDREVLVLRGLEPSTTTQIASVRSINEAAVKARHRRALERLRRRLDVEPGETGP